MPEDFPSPKHRPGPFGPAQALIPESQKLVTISDSQLVWEALELMSDQGYSQLPVLDDLGHLCGIFSYESFAQRSFELRGASNKVVDLPVRECLSNRYRLIPPDTFIDTEGENWSERDFVLVGTREKLIGILTLTDVWAVLNDFAECFVLLFEIETELREFISEVIPDEQLPETFSYLRKNQNSRPVSSLDDLTFEQYKELISHAKVWPHFEKIFGSQKGLLNVDLNEVATIRNEIFHFRKRAGNADADRLRRFRDHKIRYYREVLHRQIQTVKENLNV